MALHYSQIVSHFAHPDLQHALHHCEPFPPEVHSCLLVGPESSGKSAFLFHAAVDVAASGRVAMYICAKSRAEEIPPPLPCGFTPKDMLLANIHMKRDKICRYLDTREDLIKLAASLHLLPAKPDAIMIDDLGSFRAAPDSNAREAELMKLLALLTDAVGLFRRGDKECRLLITERRNDGPGFQYLYEQWLHLILQIRVEDGSLTMAPIFPKTVRHSYPQLQFALHPFHGVTLQDILPPLEPA